MAASVLFACGLNETKLPSYVHISEESDIDGTFLISSILGQRLRVSNSATVLVCLQHNFQNYFTAGMRLGYNLNLFAGKTLHALDVVTEIAQNLLTSLQVADGKDIIEDIIRQIHTELSEKLQNRVSVTVVIDNLAAFTNLGASEDDVLKFCHDLQNIGRSYENFSIITKLNTCDQWTVFDSNIRKLGDLVIQLVKLESGAFYEVDGKIIVERQTLNGHYKIQEARKEFLYKVNDRNIKIYNPGEVGVVI